MNVRPCWFRVWEHVSGVGLKLTPWRNGAWQHGAKPTRNTRAAPGIFPLGSSKTLLAGYTPFPSRILHLGQTNQEIEMSTTTDRTTKPHISNQET